MSYSSQKTRANRSNKLQKLLNEKQLHHQQIIHSEFAFKAPQHFIKQIERANPNDPLLQQILPVIEEKSSPVSYQKDPVGDLHKNPAPSLIQKYQGRVLLIASPKCDIHCRYCFRRHFPYEEQSNQRVWQQALECIREDHSLHEVILSGGDPMSLSENVLTSLSQKIEEIPHINTLRIHSRTPVVSPQTAAQKQWLDWAKQSAMQIVLVVHCNHPNELTKESRKLFHLYRDAGIHLLNQTVLLKNINDNIEVLNNLSHQLFQQGILPYYLHQLDKVQGAAHFEVSNKVALQLHKQLQTLLPGYLVPKIVQEIAGAPFKVPLHEV